MEEETFDSEEAPCPTSDDEDDDDGEADSTDGEGAGATRQTEAVAFGRQAREGRHRNQHIGST